MLDIRRILVAVALVAAAGPVRAEKFKAVCWNLESGEAAPSFVGPQIAAFQGVDVWGFSEVAAGEAATYAAACGKGEAGVFKHILGTTGVSDRLMIVYNSTRFELVGSGQLTALQVQTGRAPLFATLKFKAGGEQFVFMVNHLQRGNAQKRMTQAVGLEAWAKAQTLPAVLTGDYNFDVSVSTRKGNPAFVAMTDENVFRWVQQTPFRATHKGGSVLDFVFLSGPAKTWTAKTEVPVLSDDAVDTLSGSDHRPVLATFDTAGGGGADAGPAAAPADAGTARAVPAGGDSTDEAEARQKKRNDILRRIAAMEKDLVELKRMVKELADD